MPKNRFKDSPGRTLVGFAVLVFLVLAASVQDWWLEGLEWTELPTGVEDQEFYVPIGADDFREPNLRVPGLLDGLYRWSEKPLVLRDFRMRKVGRDESGRFFLYRIAEPDPDEPGEGDRIFVKAADDRYLEFGPAPRSSTESGAVGVPPVAGGAGSGSD